MIILWAMDYILLSATVQVRSTREQIFRPFALSPFRPAEMGALYALLQSWQV